MPFRRSVLAGTWPRLLRARVLRGLRRSRRLEVPLAHSSPWQVTALTRKSGDDGVWEAMLVTVENVEPTIAA